MDEDDLVVFSVTSASLFESAGMSKADSAMVADCADIVMRAVLQESIEVNTDSGDSPTTRLSAPLLIPGTRYHISLKKASAAAFWQAVRIVAGALLLQRLQLLELSVTFSVASMASILEQVKQLSEVEQRVVEAILSAKHEYGSLMYWPTAQEIAERSGLPEADTLQALTALSATVVEYNSDHGGWKLRW